MARQIICALTILAILNLALACTSTVTVMKGEMAEPQSEIIGLMLTTDETVDFDHVGGTFNTAERTFHGMSETGEEIRIHIAYVSQVRLRTVANGEPRTSLMTGKSFEKTFGAPKDEKIVAAVLINGRVVDFDEQGARVSVAVQSLVGITTAGERVTIPLDDILYFQVRKTDVGKTLLATFGVVALAVVTVGIIAVATKESCPFFYSFDGERYVFDAEPLGGAICRGLKRTDYSRLEHLVADEGTYRLFVHNEVAETQYLDEVALVIVDHDPSFEIFPDSSERLYYVSEPVLPASITDEKGKDLLPFVRERDGIFWQSKMPTDSGGRVEQYQHEVIATFPKPRDADSVKLLFNGGASLWGSNMIREMLLLYGEGLPGWYADVDSGGVALDRMFSYLKREQIYLLKIETREGDGWVSHGYLQPGGPLITEDRVIALDISRIPGDSLTFRFSPPFGYWTIDYLAVDYGSFATPEAMEIPVTQASDQIGIDKTSVLRTEDESYLVLPEIGDWATFSFTVPQQAPGTSRSIFLKSTGYYKIHLPEESVARADILAEFAFKQGAIVEYSLKKWFEWLVEMETADGEIRK